MELCSLQSDPLLDSDMSLAGASITDVTAVSGSSGETNISRISLGGQSADSNGDAGEVMRIKSRAPVPVAKLKQWMLAMVKQMDLHFSEHPP
jgi:hypothetical protein